jgi:hypothetical protein
MLVTIGRGIGYISGNTIEGNGQEGIWCGGIAEIFGMYSKGGSKSVIVDNVISHNGLSGLSFDGDTSRSNSNTVKLIFNYETVHCFDGTIVASLDSHLSHVMYSAIVHLNPKMYRR